MKVFVLAGGEGTRLKPYTYNTPKPMLVLGGKPILEYVLQNIKKAGYNEVVLTVGYKHEQIQSYFEDGSRFGMNIEYAVEGERLNTAGSILPHKDKVDDTFAVVMGDHLTNLDLSDMFEHHKKSGAAATIALFKDSIPLEYGVAHVENGSIRGFQEKPLLEKLYNTAIYIFEPEIFEHIQPKEDFAKNVIPRLLAENRKVSAYVFDDVWFDIGRVSDYERFSELFRVIKLVDDLQ
ncbi:NTP transferase domain-containing protein [Candidatus Micrarchaeota archaeon]|nr:NTP transferase domain-containing protein [Candidatus Micrarchaeota archaeon]